MLRQNSVTDPAALGHITFWEERQASEDKAGNLEFLNHTLKD